MIGLRTGEFTKTTVSTMLLPMGTRTRVGFDEGTFLLGLHISGPYIIFPVVIISTEGRDRGVARRPRARSQKCAAATASMSAARLPYIRSIRAGSGVQSPFRPRQRRASNPIPLVLKKSLRVLRDLQRSPAAREKKAQREGEKIKYIILKQKRNFQSTTQYFAARCTAAINSIRSTSREIPSLSVKYEL